MRSLILWLVLAVLLPDPSAVAVGVARASDPWQDDAALNDVCFLGRRLGWIAGEHGVLWATRDEGTSWSLVGLPVGRNVSLRSVCFLTDQVGWVGGGTAGSPTVPSAGLVLQTTDGGRTWQDRSSGLPGVHHVRFFSLAEGIVAGDATSEHPTGVLVTRDGGRSWQDAPGPRQHGWRAAAFDSTSSGIVAGLRGIRSRFDAGLPRISLPTGFGHPDLHAVARDSSQSSPRRLTWLVGDGGLVLVSRTAGVAWQSPVTPLPEQIGSAVDFQTVAARGQRAWIAGSPGSVVWYTPDGGRRWQRQLTGQPLPLRALDFSDENHGWAVGELGVVLKTVDGGRNWQVVRGAGRRLAMLSVYGQPGNIAFAALAREAGNGGYRCRVVVVPRQDSRLDRSGSRGRDVRIAAAVRSVGGSGVEVGWRLPLEIPELERDEARLRAHWQRQTDGRLDEELEGELVSLLRTWRPSVVVVRRAARDEALGGLVRDAVLRAVAAAGDATRYLSLAELGGLQPWTVRRVFEQLPAGSRGPVVVRPDEFLPGLGETTGMAAAAARRQVARSAAEPANLAFRPLSHPGAKPEDFRGSGFFWGLGLARGTAARRPSVAAAGARENRLGQVMVSRQRALRVYLGVSNRHGGLVRDDALMGQIPDLVAGLPSHLAARQLGQLSDVFRSRSRSDLVATLQAELILRDPRGSMAAEGLVWLLQYYGSEELGWQRVRSTRVDLGRVTSSGAAVEARLAKLFERLRAEQSAAKAASAEAVGAGYTVQPVVRATRPKRDIPAATVRRRVDVSVPLRNGVGADRREAVRRSEREWALRSARRLRQSCPEAFGSPQVQFPLAALLRARGQPRLADDCRRRFTGAGGGDSWRVVARQEEWLVRPAGEPPESMVGCRRARERPQLDGVLSDPCWQQAIELRLRPGPTNELDREYGFAQLAWDDEYLYFAASVPRVPQVPVSPPSRGNRSHDADLAGRDRIRLVLDVDRDYATWYRLEFDQRGWVNECCWEDRGWNPRMFVATDGDATRWRIEAAISLKDLVPLAPRFGETWAVEVVRTVPGHRLSAWTMPAGVEVRPESFGLVRFVQAARSR